MSGTETNADKNRRIRTARIAVIASIAWWIVSIGGIITVVTLQS